MKTKEELNALKEEIEALSKKLAELSENELAQVFGGEQESRMKPHLKALKQDDENAPGS